MILRNFLVACVAFLPGEDVFIQLMYLNVVFLVYFVLQIRFWPWHSLDLNCVDAVQSATIIGIVLHMILVLGQSAFSPCRQTSLFGGIN